MVIKQLVLKDAEKIVRLTMILILLTAGTSKFFSQGAFYDYYSQLFQGELRINLPPFFVNTYLTIIPFMEVSLGLALISTHLRQITTYLWFGFMMSLLFGHYILQEWSSVNQLLDYIYLGLLCLILPSHRSLFRRDAE